MTTLIFDWSELLGQDASGTVRVRATRWRHEPDTLVVPWSRDLSFSGRETLDVDPGLVLELEWRPEGVTASLAQTIVVPAEGEHFAHLLAVDPSTLEPLEGDDLLRAQDILDDARALLTEIESGKYRGADGADGVSVESITDADGDGVATVRLSSGVESPLPLPRGPQGEPGRDGVDGEDGADGHTPSLSWQGSALTVDGVPGPDLRGPAGQDGQDGKDGVDGAPGPAPSITIGTVTSGDAPSATITGTSPDLTLGLVLPKGDRGDRGEPGAPGVVSSASAYVLVGPGRPDTPATTAGVITGAEPVGARYESVDEAGVGARTWRKVAGGRWVVTDGDTGWRDVSGLLDPTYVTGGKLLLRREGEYVQVNWNDVATNATSSDHFLTTAWPAGFRIAGNFYDAYTLSGGTSNRARFDMVLGNLRSGAPNGGLRLRDLSVKPTADPWPTSLPGSPA